MKPFQFSRGLDNENDVTVSFFRGTENENDVTFSIFY
jgi:hypothetical protein